MNELQTLLCKADLLNKPLGIGKTLLCTDVSFPVAACPLGTGDDINLIGARFQRTHEVQGLNTPAARQGEKSDPWAELFFQGTPVNILVSIDLLTEEDRYLQSRFFLIH